MHIAPVLLQVVGQGIRLREVDVYEDAQGTRVHRAGLIALRNQLRRGRRQGKITQVP